MHIIILLKMVMSALLKDSLYLGGYEKTSCHVGIMCQERAMQLECDHSPQVTASQVLRPLVQKPTSN